MAFPILGALGSLSWFFVTVLAEQFVESNINIEWILENTGLSYRDGLVMAEKDHGSTWFSFVLKYPDIDTVCQVPGAGLYL